MGGKAAKVTITEKQQAILLEFSRSRTESPIFVQRAKIVLLAFERKSCDEIAEATGLERHAVGMWRRRWQAAWPELTNFECAEPHKLREAIRDTLRDAHRSGCGGKFTGEQVTQMLAVACEPPELSGLPITHWTLQELCAEVVRRGIVESISLSQMQRYLQQAALQPHRKKCGSTPPKKTRWFSNSKWSASAKPINKLRNGRRSTARARSLSMK